jgi:hypothetical protein
MSEETHLTLNKNLLTKYLGEEVVDRILKPTEKELIRWRKIGGGKNAPYVAGSAFIARLNECFGFLWSYEVVETIKEGEHIVTKGRLTFEIPGIKETTIADNGATVIREIRSIKVVKEQYGGAEIKRYREPSGKYKAGDMLDLANDYKAASTDAMKKCAVAAGLFLDVYSTLDDSEAPGNSKKATKDQLAAIMLRGKRLGWSEEETVAWVKEETKLDMEDLEPLDAMGLIPKLMDKEKELKK